MRTETLLGMFVVVAIFAFGTGTTTAQDVQDQPTSNADLLSEMGSQFNALQPRVSQLPITPVGYWGGCESTEAGCGCDTGNCCDCGDGCDCGDACGKRGRCFVWGKDTWLSVGAGLRTSYSAVGDAAPNGGSSSNNFNIDNARLYFNGQGHKYLKFEFNTDIDNAQGFQDPTFPVAGSYDEAGNIRILDAIAKFEVHDLFNVWVGRMLPPSDRSNLSGPYYLNAWDFPFVQFGYPNIFQGRDDGVSIWGQWGGGVLKYQIGAFEGVNGAIPGSTETLPIPGANPSDDMMFTARVTLNLLDPEPGYYNQSTYYGDKDILAVGISVMDQNNANVDGAAITDFTGWCIDTLFERPLSNGGVVTVEGAYYNFDDHGATNSVRDGDSYFALASYLFPGTMSIGPTSGRLQPFTRYQRFDRNNFFATSLERQVDVGVNYIMYGHNARLAAFWTQQELAGGVQTNLYRSGVQFQF